MRAGKSERLHVCVQVRASFTSPVAMLATASMWWAMLCYQLVALAEFLAPDNALFCRWLVPGSRGLAKYLLPFGQACMAVYGLSVGINGLREGVELGEELMLVRRSAALAHFPEVQHVLRRQLSHLYVANLAAEVVAGPLLFAGQALMALGAPGVLGNVYVLAAGGLLSAVSIVSKTVVELDTESRFGYDDDALPVPQTLVSLPGHVPQGSHSFDVRTLAVIQRRREVRLRKLAWLKALSAVVPVLASKLSDSVEKCGEWSVERREQLVGAMYQHGYDFELHKCLKQILDTEDAWRALESAAVVYGGGRAAEPAEEHCGTGHEAPLGRWRPLFASHSQTRRRQQQPLYLAFLYVKGVEEAFETAGAVFHDEDECIAAEESEERWILSTATAMADATATWKTLQVRSCMHLSSMEHRETALTFILIWTPLLCSTRSASSRCLRAFRDTSTPTASTTPCWRSSSFTGDSGRGGTVPYSPMVLTTPLLCLLHLPLRHQAPAYLSHGWGPCVRRSVEEVSRCRRRAVSCWAAL